MRWNSEFGIGNAECGMRNEMEGGIGNGKVGMQNAEIGKRQGVSDQRRVQPNRMQKPETEGGGNRVAAAGRRQEQIVGRQESMKAADGKGNAEAGLRQSRPSRMRKAMHKGDTNPLQAGSKQRKIDAGRQETDAQGRKIHRNQPKTESRSLKSGTVKKVTVARNPSGRKTREAAVGEQKAKTIRPQRSKPSTPLKSTTKDGQRKAEVKQEKKKVTN